MADARHVADRTGMQPIGQIHKEPVTELFAAMKQEKVRANIAKSTKSHMEKHYSMTPISDISIHTLMLAIAQYGGRVEVEGFGAFRVHEIAEKLVPLPGGGHKIRAARRVLIFRQSNRMRDMLNEDFHNQTVPTPNKDYFIEKKNILV